ncbi:MAG: matrixin family metalloprotease [Candidatus Bathyarchaeota archaeon]|nr:matrixin family metalloprotease [Candidatus Bathyarchaeota archaeon]
MLTAKHMASLLMIALIVPNSIQTLGNNPIVSEDIKELSLLPYNERVESKSSHVFFGEVKSIECKIINTNQGKMIVSYARVEINKYNKGDGPDEVIVSYYGGEVGDFGQAHFYNPGNLIRLEEGKEYKIYSNKLQKKANEYSTYYVETTEKELQSESPSIHNVLFQQPKHGIVSVDETEGQGFAFFGWHYHEDDFPVTYRINEDGTSDCWGEKTAIENAFETWEDEHNDYVEFIRLGDTDRELDMGDGYNVFDFEYNSSVSWAGHCVLNYNANTYQILEWDIELNDMWIWYAGAFPYCYDVRSVSTHEAGHTLGLQDLTEEENDLETMYYTSELFDVTQRTLHDGDLDGLAYVYP